MKKTIHFTLLAAALIATTAGADIGGNGSADTVVWDAPSLSAGEALVKVGSNRAIIQTAAAINADIDVRGGTMVFSGRTCTNEWYRFVFNGSEYQSNTNVVIGELRVYSNTDKTENVAKDIGSGGKILSAGSSPANLQQGACVASFTTASQSELTSLLGSGAKANLWDLRNAFDGDNYAAVVSKSKHYIYNNSSQVWVAFRMAAGKNRVQCYLPAISSGIIWYVHPSAWLFQTSTDGTNWQTVDTRTGAVSSSGYGSTPFVIKGFLADGAAGFVSSANVKVASGATLDATGVAGGQALSHLTVDWAAGAGTIKGVTIAQNGVLDLVNVPAGVDIRGATIPVTLTDVAGGANFASWTVKTNGSATAECPYWNGSALQIKTSAIGSNGEDDSVLWDAPVLPGDMALVKTGSNRAIVQTASVIDADIDVQGGTMVFSGRTCTNEFYRILFNGSQYQSNTNIVIGELRVYSDTSQTENVAKDIGKDGKVLTANTAASSLNPGYCVASFATAYQSSLNSLLGPDASANLWDLRYAFDDSNYNAVLSQNKYYIYNDSSRVWIAFRMAEGNNRVQCYLPAKADGIIWYLHPSAWLFQTSIDGVNWQTVDTRTGAIKSSGYGSTPFVIKGFLADGAAGFDSSANVKVASGATLDATGVAGGQTLSHLTVDWTAGAGTIRGVTIAQNGVLDLVNVPNGTRLGGQNIPVTLTDVANGANLSTWTVRVNGAATTERLRWNGSAMRVIGAMMLTFW